MPVSNRPIVHTPTESWYASSLHPSNCFVSSSPASPKLRSAISPPKAKWESRPQALSHLVTVKIFFYRFRISTRTKLIGNFLIGNFGNSNIRLRMSLFRATIHTCPLDRFLCAAYFASSAFTTSLTIFPSARSPSARIHCCATFIAAPISFGPGLTPPAFCAS